MGGYAVKALWESALIICPTERILKMWRERLWKEFGIAVSAYYRGGREEDSEGQVLGRRGGRRG